MTERPYASIEGEDIDKQILPLLLALRSNTAVLTKGSCCGHGKKNAYVDLAVEGLPGLRIFVEALNRVDERFSEEAWLDVTLNWSREVVAACDFEQFPEWVMLSLEIDGIDGAPSTKLLKRIAVVFERELRSEP